MSDHELPYKAFLKLFNSAPDLYIVVSPEFIIVAVNDAYLRATLTSREGIVGRHMFDVFPDDPNDPDANGVSNLRASLQRVVRDKVPDAMAVQKYSVQRPGSAGGGFEERYWSVGNTPVMDDDGKLEFIIHRAEDVTDLVRLKQQGAEQSQLAEKLKDRASQMEGDIIQRGLQLQQANERLREAERVKSEFFANISHELRTPLSLILAPIETVLSRMQEAGGAPMGDSRQAPGTAGSGEGLHLQASIASDAIRQLQTAHNNAIRLLGLVTSLLDLAKTEAGRMKVQTQPTAIDTLTRAILHDFQPMFRDKNLALAAQVPNSAPAVLTDPYMFERILFNLLSNAAKFTPSGGKVSLSLEIKNDRAYLTVTDTGIGIKESDLPLLFQKFNQVESSTSRRFEGTGLGLAMVKEFAELMGGKVSVASKPGEGSTFSVEIPAHVVGNAGMPKQRTDLDFDTTRRSPLVAKYPLATRDAYERAQGAADDNIEKDMKVLVCEDNEELGAYIASLLADVCRVKLARRGDEGLRVVGSWHPDLVLSDIMMPGIDGVSLCSAIKSDPLTADTVVVLLTAQTNRDIMLKGWEAKADEYLFKPFHPDELLTRIRSLLGIIAERRDHNESIARKNKELARAEAALEQKQTIEAYARQLERKNRELEEFAYLGAHDMKSPLTSLGGLLNLMERRGAVKDEQKQLFEMVKESAAQMLRTINALNRMIAFKGELTATKETVDFSAALDEVKKTLSEMILISRAKIEADFSQCPEVHFPALHLRSVLQNLLTNAIKYTEEGKPPIIKLHSSMVEDYILLTVADRGLGIDLDRHGDKLFHLFQRFHAQKEGLGVGLYMVQSMIEGYDGKIEVESTVGKGTTFKIYFNNTDVQ